MREFYMSFLSVLSVALSVWSCEYTAVLSSLPDDARIYLECIPGLPDETAVIVGVASPCQGTVPVADLSGTEIHISAGGHPVALKYDGMAFDGTSVSFVIDGRFAPGDRVLCHVSVPGLGNVSAESTVPPAPEAFLRMERSANGENLNFYVDVDDPLGADYYAVSFARKAVEHYGTGVKEDLRSPAFEVLSVDGTFYGANADLRRSGEQPFFFSDDRSSCDGVLSFAVSCAYVQDTVHDYDSFGKFGIAYMYRVRVYRLSQEFYRYCLARYSIDNDELSSLGWAPSNFSYTNVLGGFGVLGAVCCLDLGWKDNV